MHTALSTQWLRLVALKESYEKAVLEASPEQQQFKIEAGGWNMLQIVHHLVMAEKLSMDYLIARQYDNARKGNRVSAFFRSLGLRLMLKSPLRFKAPRSLPEPAENPEPERLLAGWKRNRAEMHAYLKHFPEEKISMLIYRHPRAGWLTILQALHFFEDHLLHHQQQLKRIRRMPGFPV